MRNSVHSVTHHKVIPCPHGLHPGENERFWDVVLAPVVRELDRAKQLAVESEALLARLEGQKAALLECHSDADHTCSLQSCLAGGAAEPIRVSSAIPGGATSSEESIAQSGAVAAERKS